MEEKDMLQGNEDRLKKEYFLSQIFADKSDKRIDFFCDKFTLPLIQVLVEMRKMIFDGGELDINYGKNKYQFRFRPKIIGSSRWPEFLPESDVNAFDVITSLLIRRATTMNNRRLCAEHPFFTPLELLCCVVSIALIPAIALPVWIALVILIALKEAVLGSHKVNSMVNQCDNKQHDIHLNNILFQETAELDWSKTVKFNGSTCNARLLALALLLCFDDRMYGRGGLLDQFASQLKSGTTNITLDCANIIAQKRDEEKDEKSELPTLPSASHTKIGIALSSDDTVLPEQLKAAQEEIRQLRKDQKAANDNFHALEKSVGTQVSALKQETAEIRDMVSASMIGNAGLMSAKHSASKTEGVTYRPQIR